MDFRIKCAAQHVFSVLPGGRRLNYWMQRHVTKSLPDSDETIERYRSIAKRHLTTKPKTVFEFGSGWSLCLPILFGLSGCRVIASDVERVAEPALVEDMLRRLGARSLEAVNVQYVAPLDARRTGFPDHSFDLITSTSVLEHILTPIVRAIAVECRRLLAPGGTCSLWIDYKDHWSYFDRSITWCNFLRYRSPMWSLYNPRMQYQNRLRHSDYVGIFESAGFEVETYPVKEPVPDIVVAPEFRRYPIEDLSVSGAWFALTVPPTPGSA